MPDIHKDSVVAGNMSLLTSKMYSDITILCGLNEYKLHRAIICPRSTFFAAACKGDFMEAKTATITMNDDDPQAVRRMLFYLYALDYPDHDGLNAPEGYMAMDRSHPPHLQLKISPTIEEETSLSTDPNISEEHDPRMMNNALVYALAEKYDIPHLKELAKCKFQTLTRSKWPLDDFDIVAHAVFSTTPDSDAGLRQIVLAVCGENFHEILKQEASRVNFLEIQAIAAVLLGAALRKIDLDETLLDEALAKQIAMKEELLEFKADAQVASEEKDALNMRLDHLILSANVIEECRHCSEKFAWSMERSGSSGQLKMRLRCANCRTKHEL